MAATMDDVMRNRVMMGLGPYFVSGVKISAWKGRSTNALFSALLVRASQAYFALGIFLCAFPWHVKHGA